MNKLVLPLLLALVVVVGIVIGSSSDPNKKQNNTTSPYPSDESVSVTTSDSNQEFIFSTPKKTAHLSSSEPSHGTVVSSVPKEVKINFDSELGVNSNIAITREGKDFSVGNTIVSSNRLNLSKAMGADMPDGLYTVSYTACWPDGTCYDGSFQFAIKR